MTKLGLNFLNGVGVEQDSQRACYWLERAAEKGNVEAMYFAGEAWRDVKPNGAAIATFGYLCPRTWAMSPLNRHVMR